VSASPEFTKILYKMAKFLIFMHSYISCKSPPTIYQILLKEEIMMKSFFKKLAFVMALAMVVSMVAPAAQTAVAAEDKALAIAYQKGAVITALNLTEVGATEDLRFVYAPANWKELGATWSSSNENVVSVDANGVVKAEAAGTATISVAVGAETASIEVYSVDTTTFVATMGTADNRAMTELELTVGDEFDFAFYGIKDYSVDRYRCDWFAVDPDSVLEFDASNGKLVAKKAGSAKISLGVMNLVTGLKTDVAPCVVTVKEATPDVDPNNFEVTKMVSDSKFELTFENKKITADEVQKGLSVYYYVGNQRIQYNYPKTTEVKDGVVTVEFHQLVTDGTTYGFKYAGIEKEYTVKIGEPASMYITWMDLGGTYHWNCAYAGYATELQPHILNAEGADITASVLNTAQGKYVEFSLADASVAAQYYMQGNNQIYFTAANQTAVVVGKLYNGFDNYGQRIESVSSAPTAITSTVRPIRTFEFQTAQAASVTGNVWDNKTKIAVADDQGTIHGTNLTVRLVDNYGNAVDVSGTNRTFDSEAGLGIYGTGLGTVTNRYYGEFLFASDNISIFTIGETTGHMVAHRAGQANVLVYYDPDMYNSTRSDKVLVAVVPFTTYDRRVATTFEVDSNYKTVSTQACDGNYNEVEFQVTIKDQVGDKFDATKPFQVYTKSVAANGITNPVLSSGDLTVDRVERGVYKVKITCKDSDAGIAPGASRAVYYGVSYNYREVANFTANVVWPVLSDQAHAYAFDASTTKSWKNDCNPFADSWSAELFLNASLYRYKNGVKVAKENVQYMTNDIWTNPAVYASFDTTYVKVLKNGSDITNKMIGNGDGTRAVEATGNAVEVKLAAAGILNSDGYAIIDNELGAGSYTVLAYKAAKSSSPWASASPAAMQLIASSTIDVKDTKPAVTYLGKTLDNVSIADQGNLDLVAMNCFSVKFGDTVLKQDNWNSVKVKANALQINSNTVYFESIEVYVPTNGVWGNSTTYVRYEVKIGDYVVFK